MITKEEIVTLFEDTLSKEMNKRNPNIDKIKVEIKTNTVQCGESSWESYDLEEIEIKYLEKGKKKWRSLI